MCARLLHTAAIRGNLAAPNTGVLPLQLLTASPLRLAPASSICSLPPCDWQVRSRLDFVIEHMRSSPL
eukprot:8277301-Pyramimonas_sp.AAC.1